MSPNFTFCSNKQDKYKIDRSVNQILIFFCVDIHSVICAPPKTIITNTHTQNPKKCSPKITLVILMTRYIWNCLSSNYLTQKKRVKRLKWISISRKANATCVFLTKKLTIKNWAVSKQRSKPLMKKIKNPNRFGT